MKNSTEIVFFKPQVEDLWFRQALLADPATMSYNDAWGGTIDFSRDRWEPLSAHGS